MSSRTGRCTVRIPARWNSRSKPTAVRALSLKALPSISSNVVPVLLPKRPTHALQLYSFGMEFDVTQRYAMSTLEREERRNPCGVPQPQSLQSPQPWFSALRRSGAEHQVAGVILGRARIPSCYFGFRVAPGKGLRRQSVLDTCAPATSILPSQLVATHIWVKGEDVSKRNIPWDATSITLFLEQCLLEYTSEPAECGSVMQC